MALPRINLKTMQNFSFDRIRRRAKRGNLFRLASCPHLIQIRRSQRVCDSLDDIFCRASLGCYKKEKTASEKLFYYEACGQYLTVLQSNERDCKRTGVQFEPHRIYSRSRIPYWVPRNSNVHNLFCVLKDTARCPRFLDGEVLLRWLRDRFGVPFIYLYIFSFQEEQPGVCLHEVIWSDFEQEQRDGTVFNKLFCMKLASRAGVILMIESWC